VACVDDPVDVPVASWNVLPMNCEFDVLGIYWPLLRASTCVTNTPSPVGIDPPSSACSSAYPIWSPYPASATPHTSRTHPTAAEINSVVAVAAAHRTWCISFTLRTIVSGQKTILIENHPSLSQHFILTQITPAVNCSSARNISPADALSAAAINARNFR